jgi:hypothetical protein
MRRNVSPLLGVVALVVASGGCDLGPDESSIEPAGAPWEGLEAGEFLSVLEERLLGDGTGQLEFQVRAEGAFEAELSGIVDSGEDRRVELEADGTFGGEFVTLSLTVRGGRLLGGSSDRRFDEPVPPELHEAVVIGLTRMGILHNLARLVGGMPPDRAGGGVQGWVEAREVEWRVDNVEAGRRGVTFEIWVEDQPAGEAALWLDAEGELVGRDQVVRFPGGEMVVRERYQGR